MDNYNEEDVQWLYGRMVDDGVDAGTIDDFKESLKNDADRDWYYKRAKKMGLDVGDADEFRSWTVPDDTDDEADDFDTEVGQAVDSNNRMTGHIPEDMQDASWNYQNYGQKYNGPGGQAMFTDEELAEQIAATRDANQPTANAVDTSGTTWLNSDVERGYISGKRENPNKGVTYQQKESWTGSYARTPDEFGEMHYGWQRGERVKRLNKQGLEFAGYGGHKGNQYYNEALDAAEQMSDDEIVATYDQISKAIGPNTDYKWFANTDEGYRTASQLKALQHELHARDLGFAHDRDVENPGMEDYAGVRTDKAVADLIDSMDNMSQQERDAMAQAAYDRGLDGEGMSIDDQNTMLAVAAIRSRENGRRVEDNYRELQQQVEYGSLYSTLERDMDKIFSEEKGAMVQREEDAVGGMVYAGGEGSELAWANARTIEAIKAGNLPETFNTMTNRLINESEAARRYVNRRVGELSKQVGILQARAMARDELRQMFRTKYIEGNPLTPKSDAQYIVQTVLLDNMWSKMNQASMGLAAGAPYHEMKATIDEGMQMYAQHEASTAARIIAPCAVLVFDAATGSFMPASYAAKGATALYSKGVNKAISWLGNRLFGIGSEMAIRRAGENTALRILGSAIGGAANFATYEFESELFGGTASGNLSAGNLAHAAVGGAGKGFVFGFVGGVAGKATEGLTGMGALLGEVGTIAAEGTTFTAMDYLQTGQLTPESIGTSFGMAIAGRMAHPAEYASNLLGRVVGLNAKNAPSKPPRISKEMAARLQNDYPALTALLSGDGLAKDIVKSFKGSAIDKQDAGSRLDAIEEEYRRLKFDSNVPWSVVRIAEYVVQGRVIPQPWMMNSDIRTDENGNEYGVTLDGDGRVIEEYKFKNENERDKWRAYTSRQSDINRLNVAAQNMRRSEFTDILESTINEVAEAQGMDANALRDVVMGGDLKDKKYRKSVKDKAYLQSADDVQKAVDAKLKATESPVDVAIRAVENKYGISIEQALEYPVYQRTEREAKAVEELQQRLNGEYAPENDMSDAEIIEAEKAEAHDEGFNAEGEERANLKERLEDAANALGEMGINPADIDGMDDAALAQWMQEREMDAETATAVMNYQNAKAAFEGVRDRVQDEAGKRIEESNRQTDERTNPDTGSTHPVKMNEGSEEGRDAFVIGGKITINQDGTVNRAQSDESITVLYPDTGEKKVKTITDIKSGEPTIDPEQAKQEAAQQITEEVAGQAADDMNRALPFNVGDTYDVMKGGVVPEKVTVIGLDVNGDPILQDSKGELVNKEADANGNPIGVKRDWVQEMADQHREFMKNGGERPVEEEPVQSTGPRDKVAPAEEKPAERKPTAPAVGGDPMERVVYYRMSGKSEERIEKEIANNLETARQRLERAQQAWDESKETDDAKLDALEQELNDARREVEYWQEVDRYRKASREPENARPEPRTSLGEPKPEQPTEQPIERPAQERRPAQSRPAERWQPSGPDERESKRERPAGFSEEDKRFWSREGDDIVEVMDQAAKDMGLAVATYDDPNGENGYIQGGVIYLNSAKGRAAVGFVMGHEMTHEMQRRDQKDGEDGKKEDGDRYKRFRDLALQYAEKIYTPTRVNGVRCDTYEDYLKARLDLYQDHIRETTRNRVFKENWDAGMDNDSAMAIADREAEAAANAFTMDDLKNEVTADTAGMFLDDADMARKILGQEQDLSWLQRQKEALMEWLEKKLAQLTGHGEEYKKMKELQQSLQDIYQEAVRKGRGDQTQDQAIRYSLDTMANQFGLRYEKGADGKTHFYEDYGRDKEGNPIRGREITKFMPVHIERSPVGAVLRQGLKDGFIDEEQYNRTIANQCAIMQYMKDTDNLDQFFAVSGAIGFAQLPADAKAIQRDYYKIDTQGRVAFTPYVSNSETQYATSFDVTTICRKTQTMIDVMCETMKRQHHGLTADEVVKIVYDNVYKLGKGRNDGGDVLVPCDVCYVFNRWVNLGKVFDTMRRMRDTYSDMSIEDIRKEREKTVTDLCDFYRVSGNAEEYQTYKDYVDARARYDAMKPKDRKTDEGKDLAKSLKKFDAAMKDAMVKRQQAVAEEIEKLNWKIFNYEHLLKKDPAYKPTAKDMKRLEELQRELDYLDKGTWFDYVRLQDDYMPIPDEVLFDMNKSYEFKENYPGAWKYRTTRGPNAGKAAAAYSPQYFGNGIVGASKSATSGPEAIQDLSNNVFLAREEGADGKWHYKYIDEETWTLKPEAVVVLRKAQDNAAAQNYLGGQRFQSTSDTRTEYLTDYNTFMLEQMAIGSKGQGFTKVPECAKLFGDTGTMFNLSLIAKGKGYEELTPAQYKALSEEDKRDCAVIDGKILHALYSDVSGINHRDAFKLNDYYPNLQPIMVCINRTHTRLMMALAKEGRVPFNIPYHASGDSTDRFLSKAATVGDDVDMESRDDYEPYQNDLVIDPKDKQTAMVRDVFVKIKTGADFTDAEMAYLRGLDHDNVIRQLYMRFRGEDVDGRPARILNKYLLKDDRNTAGEGYGAFDSQCRVKAYDSKTGEYLKDENGNFVYKQVKLNSRQAALLMPNDYWDKTISRDRADENGQAFLDLCAQQGLYPRFGGWKNVQGKRVYSPDHDFTKEPGYYSTLIDISMYNNDGSPVEHKAIDASAIGDGHFIKEKMTQLGDYKLSELGGNPKLSHPALQDAVYKSVMDVAANRAKETIAFAKQVKAMRESGESGKSVITDDTPSWIESEWRNNPAFVREVARLSAMSDKQLAAWERRRMQEAENNATAAPGDGEVHYSLREEDPPKKTIKVYKLFNVFPKGHPHAGEPMTLFIDSNQPLQRGVWLNADAPSIENLEGLEPGFAYLMDADGNVLGTKQVKRSGNKISGLPGKTQVYQASQDGCRWITVTLDADGAKSYHNVGINGSGSPSAYAMRPGWHATDAPSARHIGEGKDGGNAVYRRSNQRWFEVEIAADNDYNEEARSRYAQLHPKMKREDIDANLKGDIPERIPKDGYYNFKTNSNANPNQSWYIAGAMKIGRPLSEAEARRLAEEKGVEPDLPYKDGVKDFDEEDFNPDGPQGGGRRYSLGDVEEPERSPLLKEWEEGRNFLMFGRDIATLKDHYNKGQADYIRMYRDEYRREARHWNRELNKDLKQNAHWADENTPFIKTDRANLELNTKLADYASRLLDDLMSNKEGHKSWDVKRNKEISIDEMDEMFKTHNKNLDNDALWGRVLAVSRQLGVDNIKFKKSPDRVSGRILGGRVRFDDEYFNDNAISDDRKCQTMLHEMIHHVTVYALDHQERLNEVQANAVRELKNIYSQIREDPAFRNFYGTKNVKEMVAELANPQFRDALKKKSLLYRIFDSIKRLFFSESSASNQDGVYNTNAYKAVLENFVKLLDNFDSDAYNVHARDTRQYRPRFSLAEGEKASGGTYFSGGGLIESGLKDVLDSRFGVEYDEKIAGVYRNNHGENIVVADVRNVDPMEMANKVDGPVQYFHASPVCTRYSKTNAKRGEQEIDIETAKSTANAIDKMRPRIVTIENVADYKKGDALDIIVNQLKELKYNYDIHVVNAADYGAATRRTRLILRAVAPGYELPAFPEGNKKPTPWYERVEDLIPTLKETHIPRWIDERLAKAGIDWRNVSEPIIVFGGSAEHGGIQVARSNEPAPTLPASGASDDRIILPGGKVLEPSPRVLARIMGLPDNYELPEARGKVLSHRVLGNGIPVELTKGIIEPLIRDVADTPERARLDEEYIGAVKNGDIDKALRMLQEKAAITEGITPYIAPHGYGGSHADIAKRLKTNEGNAVVRAVADMQRFVPDNAVLVPMPPHEGKVADSTDTMILADALSVITGKPVVVALEGNPRESRYAAKAEGRSGVSAEEMGFKRVADIPEGKVPIIIDNVVGSGETAKAAVNALGGGITLAYAKGTRSKATEGLKNATITYDDNGNIIPLSQRFDLSKDDVRFSLGDKEPIRPRIYSDGPEGIGMWAALHAPAVDDLKRDLRKLDKAVKEKNIPVLEGLLRQFKGTSVRLANYEEHKPYAQYCKQVAGYIADRLHALGSDKGGHRWNIERDKQVSLDDLDAMFKSSSKDEYNNELWDMVMATARQLGVEDVQFKELKQELGGATLGGRIRYNADWFEDPLLTEAQKSHVLLHELIHSSTLYALDLYDRFGEDVLSPKVAGAVKDLKRIFEFIKNDGAFADDYGQKDDKEMVAELSDPIFRDHLKKKNFWKKIVDGIVRLFRTAYGGGDRITAHDEIRKAVETILESPDVDAYDHYNEVTEGRANEIRFSLSEDIENYRPRDVSWERSMLDHLMETAGRNREAVDKRRDALRTLNSQAGALRKAMSKQRAYDRWTVDDLVSMAKSMLKSGLYKDMSPYEVSRLVGMINQGAGREDITRQANSVFDMMMKHHVKEWRNQFNKLLMVRENRIDKNGVRVQGALDPQGQRMVKALRGALGFDEDTLNDRILDCRDRMGSDDPVVAGNAVDEYEGLMLAQQHYDTVGRLTKALEELQHERRVQLERVYEYWREERLDDYGNVIYRQDGLPSTVEKHRLRPEFGGLGEDGNRMPVSEENKAIRKQVDATVSRIEQAMRETEVELADGYRSLCDNVGGSVAASITRAKEWVESEKERVSDIQHAANSDLLNTEEKLSGMDRSKEKGIANNAVVRFINSPLGSFEKFMRYFGQRSAYGEGRLFNKFMRGHSDCTDAEWRAYKEGLDAMNRKSDELFGCSWEELMVKMRGGAFANTKGKLGIEREFPPVEVSYWVDGKRVDDTLNQDEVAYLIACSKMTDGMMKLENMGIDEAMIEQLRQQVDPKMLKLADWYQGEFLPKQRARINEVYRRMFGADMAHIDNYIHLNINQRGLNENKDINQRMAVSETPSTITGSLKERKRNVKPIDLHTSLLDLAMEEHQKMENWIAWAEYNRDLKDLLNYKKFKNKVVNMKSVELGSGEQLWDKFTKTVAVVTGDFQGGGKHSEMDRFATNAAKFVSSGCINFRVHTALKQVLSFPAFMSDARPGDILHAAGNAMGSVQWAMENLPGFSKRWESRRVGDTRLMDTDSDYSFWRNRWVQKVNKAGMTANASVDCLTVAIGARAVYETAKRRYLSYGYTEAQAERKALQDAYVSYNSSQQSSEGAFVSPMQVERTFLSAIGTTFRNASMGYERRVTTGARNLARMLKKGYKEDMVENTKKQMMEEGLTEEQAQRAAERVYNRQVWHSMMDVANFGYALPFLWILGPTLSYLLAGDDKDIKKDTLADLARHAMFGPIEGLTFGGVMSELGNMVVNNRVQGNEWKDLWKELKYKDLTPLPLVSRMQGLVKSFGKGWWEGINDLAGLLIQSNIGVDPNTLTDAGVAILDACNGDLDLSKEVALGLMRILQFPQSQIDNLYIDELGLKGEDLGKYSYEELARRYAHYKTSRAVLPSAMREDDANQEAEDKMVERFEEKVQERIATMDDEQLRRTFDSNDPDLKKMAGKQMAKNAGLDNEKFSKAPASNATERTARAHTTYQRIRSYADMAEDLLLESAQNKAKESGDEERKDAISKAREKLNAIINGKDAKGNKSEVKGLGQGEDKKVMERLREERKKVLKELKITR